MPRREYPRHGHQVELQVPAAPIGQRLRVMVRLPVSVVGQRGSHAQSRGRIGLVVVMLALAASPALAADRTPYIDQAQSLNLFIPADVEKWDLLMLHFRAWELGIKSLYYLRSKSIQRAGFAGGVEADNTIDLKQIEVEAKDYDECLACQ
mgnify:CR=1 FL=1